MKIWLSGQDRTVELSLPGGTFPHQKSMAGCETLLLLDLHRAVKFHYEMRQHVDRYLGQDIFNSVLMGVRCHPAHRDILCAAEDSSSGQMKTWSCSFSKWSLITCAQGAWRAAAAQTRPLVPRNWPSSQGWMGGCGMCTVRWCTCMWKALQTPRWRRRLRRKWWEVWGGYRGPSYRISEHLERRWTLCCFFCRGMNMWIFRGEKSLYSLRLLWL